MADLSPESALGFVFGVSAQTEMKIWCITGMCMPKVVSSETNLGVKGFKITAIDGTMTSLCTHQAFL